MKKTLWALAGALLLLALVLGVKTCADRATHRERFVFDTLKVDEVVRLEMEYQGESATLEKKDGLWRVASDGYPADTARVRMALNGLLRTRATEKVSESQDP